MTIGIGILGSGRAAEIHSKTLKAVAPDVRRWYASRDGERGAAMSSRFGGAGHFGSYDAALSSRDIESVLIVLPPALHLEWTLRALDAGKHVIVEKPPFLSTADFDRVEAAAIRAGRQVLVAENYFYKPLTHILRRTIHGGDLGDVLFLQLNALKHQKTNDWRDVATLAGGGALFEGGIHWVSLLANIGLTPARVRASFPRARREAREAGKAGWAGGAGRAGGPGEPGATRPGRPLSGPPDRERNAVVTIEYAEGAVATLCYSWDLPALVNGVRMSRVFGTRGSLRFETNGLFALLTGGRTRLFLPGLGDLAGYRAMMTDFVAAIEQGRTPAYNLTLARRDLQLIEEAYASTGSQPT
jgi:predicted dehydrogenase